MGGFGVLLDVIVAGLLGATLLHVVRLHRALGALRQDRGALDRAVAGFDEGARAAEAGAARLRHASDEVSGLLDRATEVRDDLAYLSDRGDGLADRLDGLVRVARDGAGGAGGERLAVGGVATAGAAVRSRAERNLLVALQGRR